MRAGGPVRALLAALLLLGQAASAETFRSFEGHGGPVMDVAVRGDRLLTGSFDYAVGLWPVAGGAPRWLDGHRAAVTDVAWLDDGRALSSGDDFAAILWDLGTGTPIRTFEGHQGKVAAVAPSPDGTTLATASWDGTVRLWDIATGQGTATLDAHDGAVNDVAWARDGQGFWSAGADGTVRAWAADGTDPRILAEHGFGVNVLASGDGWLAYGGVDGGLIVVDPATGDGIADLSGDRRPILALAQSPDGTRLAVGDGEGYIMVVRTADWGVERDFRAAANGPVWALAFTADGTGLVAGGIADEAFLWPIDGGTDDATDAPRMAGDVRAFHTDPDAVPNGERQFLRKCSVCHELGADGARRAGPPLAGLFGREAGTVEGYAYSDALDGSGIVWDETTIDRLFDLGPDHYTPGSKMPMQRIASPEDRADLIDFLRRATAVQ